MNSKPSENKTPNFYQTVRNLLPEHTEAEAWFRSQWQDKETEVIDIGLSNGMKFSAFCSMEPGVRKVTIVPNSPPFATMLHGTIIRALAFNDFEDVFIELLAEGNHDLHDPARMTLVQRTRLRLPGEE